MKPVSCAFVGLHLLIGSSLMYAQDVVPVSYASNPSPACDGGSETASFSVLLPTGAINNKLDIVLLLDDTGSFARMAPVVLSVFRELVDDLEASLPGVDLAFGITRFEDYGGPAFGYSTERPEGRPFILNQAIIRTANPAFGLSIATGC